ncbi:MAG: putative capsid protein [Cressdnaviricota sp.]|nr:MAG: putative capsid protein [Cressdnaviricota sp.]
MAKKGKGKKNAATNKRKQTASARLVRVALRNKRAKARKRAKAPVGKVVKGRKARNAWKTRAAGPVKKNIEAWATAKTRTAPAIASLAPYDPNFKQKTVYFEGPYEDWIQKDFSNSNYYTFPYSINPYDPYAFTGGRTPKWFTELGKQFTYFEVRKVEIQFTFRTFQGQGGVAGDQFFQGPFELILQKSQDNVTFPRTNYSSLATGGYGNYMGPATGSILAYDYSRDFSAAEKQTWFKRQITGNPDKAYSMSMTWTPADYCMTAESAEEANFRQEFANFNNDPTAGTGMNNGTAAGFWYSVRPIHNLSAWTVRYSIQVRMRYTLLLQGATSTPGVLRTLADQLADGSGPQEEHTVQVEVDDPEEVLGSIHAV